MSSDVVTLALNGEVSLTAFVDALHHLSTLVEALTIEIGAKGSILWVVDDLQVGSAVATIRGEPTQGHDATIVHHVVRAYGAVGQSLERGERPAYSGRVIRAAAEIVGLVAGRVASVRFETAECDATVAGVPPADETATALVHAHGAVEGQVQTVTDCGSLRFTLYDSLYDRAVRCFLEDGQQELARDVWGRRVIVEGFVSRDPVFGYPVTIRRIARIYPRQTVEPDSYRRAHALLPRETDEDVPEERIRRVRDAG